MLKPLKILSGGKRKGSALYITLLFVLVICAAALAVAAIALSDFSPSAEEEFLRSAVYKG